MNSDLTPTLAELNTLPVGATVMTGGVSRTVVYPQAGGQPLTRRTHPQHGCSTPTIHANRYEFSKRV